jgi:phosphate transport system permease protein
VFAALVGTAMVTLLMCIWGVPMGVLAALYLSEYARPVWLCSTARIFIANLAGAPSLVFGVFGLGFFCYFVGSGIDEWFFAASLPRPTFGKGCLLWASMTVALVTLPIIIVVTEEALAAVPNSLREASYACGASRWQTIRRIVLPRAWGGVVAGAMLAIGRAAGAVAPLMMVGAVMYHGPLFSSEPMLRLRSSFPHLAHCLFDFRFANAFAFVSRHCSVALLLLALVLLMQVPAYFLRSRFRRKMATEADHGF